MTQPTPPDNNPLAPFTDLLKTTVEAFSRLPPLLSYGGVIAVILIIGLSLFGVIPEALLWIPVVAIGAFLVYAYMQFADEKAKRQHELYKQAQELKHQEEMARLAQTRVPPAGESRPPPPRPSMVTLIHLSTNWKLVTSGGCSKRITNCLLP